MLTDQRKKKGRKRKTARTWQQAGQGVLLLPKQNTIIQDRLIETAGLLAESDKQAVTFQHSILCQTCLPYRDPGHDVRTMGTAERDALPEVEAGEAMHPEQGRLSRSGCLSGRSPGW